MTARPCPAHGTWNYYCVDCVRVQLAAAERVVEAAMALAEEHRFTYMNVEYGDPMIKLVSDVERTTQSYVEWTEAGGRTLPARFCDSCDHPQHRTWMCDVVKTSARLHWTSRCECSNYRTTDALTVIGETHRTTEGE